MAAPSGTVWGSTVGGYGKIGIYTKFTDTATTRKVEIEVWFASKYSVSDGNNTLYYNRRLENKEASTSVRTGSIYISKNNDDGAGWNAANAVKLWSDSHTYTLQTSSSTIYLAAKLANVDRVGGTMKVSRSFTVPALASYTISYDLNGGSGTFNAQTKYYGNAITLRSGSPTRTGYSFLGWSTSKTATTATYSAGGTLPANTNANTILYAVWRENTYTITFNANGGSGGPTLATKHYTRALTLPTEIPTRTNYNFLGWSTSKTATTESYKAGGSFTTNAATTLYAVWKLAYEKPKITKVSVDRCTPKMVTNYVYSNTGEVLNLSEDGSLFNATTDEGESVYEYIDANGASVYYCMVDGVKYIVTADSVTSEDTDADGNTIYKYSDEGKSAFVSFKVECWKPEDESKTETISSIKINWTGSNGESSSSESGADFDISESGISVNTFEGSILIGDDELDLESVYDIEIIVADTTSSNTVYVTLQGLKVAIDAIPGNEGVSFGKPAELKDHADFNFTIYPRKGFKNVPIKKYTDFNELTIPNTYVSQDYANDTYVNCPAMSGTFTLDVSDAGQLGQIRQIISYTNKKIPSIWIRYHHSNSWGKWYEVGGLKSAITVGISTNVTPGKADGVYKQITFNKVVKSIGNGLSLSDGSVTIGPGVQYVSVSAITKVTCGSTISGLRYCKIRRNRNGTDLDLSWNSVTMNASTQQTLILPPLVVDVEEGDKIYLCFYTTDPNDQCVAGGSNGNQTYMTVQSL